MWHVFMCIFPRRHIADVYVLCSMFVISLLWSSRFIDDDQRGKHTLAAAARIQQVYFDTRVASTVYATTRPNTIYGDVAAPFLCGVPSGIWMCWCTWKLCSSTESSETMSTRVCVGFFLWDSMTKWWWVSMEDLRLISFQIELFGFGEALYTLTMT